MNEYIAMLNSYGIEYKINECLKKYSTYKTGGDTKIMVFPKNHNELKIATATNLEYVAIGNGSNILFSDYGYDGIVINTKNMVKMRFTGSLIVAECGLPLSKLRESAELNCLGGLEFTEGIPATVGGAVCMNAGCFSKSISEYIAYVITNNGIFNNEQCEFGYRTSIFDKNKGEIISSVAFMLKPSELDVIESKKERFKKLRKSSQPLGKSCGSVFLNDGYFAGKVIDQAGLKGYTIGGATVSEKHANFIINNGQKSSDVYKLIKLIKDRVYNTQKIKLKEELRFIGKFDD
ncbi:MAG: UDP-N-acetylmuramate dehydrogenase [Clostridia bacterium]|nr:UDP-N-acetylmuramate dehydrogenase [Clostridia bacterium]